jgi:hypothetical protein
MPDAGALFVPLDVNLPWRVRGHVSSGGTYNESLTRGKKKTRTAATLGGNGLPGAQAVPHVSEVRSNSDEVDTGV